MPRKNDKLEPVKRKMILLVDDHPLMRRGQADLLNRESDFAVCGEAGTACEAMEAIAKLKPDLVLVDMGLLLEGRRWAVWVEAARITVLAAVLFTSGDLLPAPLPGMLTALVTAGSLAGLWWSQRKPAPALAGV